MTTPAPSNKTPVPNTLIAVMGATGTGKSTLIHTLTGDNNIVIGHGQESQTNEVEEFAYFDSENNCSVTLIDTPGFDDSRDGVSDTDVLRKIVCFLQKNGGQRLNGLIYVHRISDPKMGGISKRNLRMFKQLCGDDSLRNVCIATTNWDRVTKEEGDRREQELRESPNLFKPLINEGAQFARHDKGITSARSIVNFLIHKDPTKLQIQVELDAGKSLEDTSTGAGLLEEILALKAKQEAELLALKEEMEEAAREKHAELLAELEEERQKREAQRKKMEEDLENLKMQARSDKVKHEEEMRRLKDKMAMDSKQTKAELLAESEAREELERNNRERLDLLKQQAQRDKDKHEADLLNLNKRMEETKARAEQEQAELVERERLEQVKRDKEKMQAKSDKVKHEEEMRRLKDKMAMDAKQTKAELLAEREAREESERNNRERLDLLKQQASRDKDKHEADLLNLNKKMEAAKTRAGQEKAELVERERLEQAKRDKEKHDAALKKRKEAERESEARKRKVEAEQERKNRAEQERKNQAEEERKNQAEQERKDQAERTKRSNSTAPTFWGYVSSYWR